MDSVYLYNFEKNEWELKTSFDSVSIFGVGKTFLWIYAPQKKEEALCRYNYMDPNPSGNQ